MTPVHLELKNALNSLDAHLELTNTAAKVSEIASYIPILRLRWKPNWDGCQSALWDCFGGQICRHFENSSPKTVPQCTWQPSRPGLQRNLKVANSKQ